jgi:hypothetical protein
MRVILVVLLVLLLVPGWAGEDRLDLWRPHPDLRAERIALDSSDPRRDRAGALRYLGGVVLTSSDPAFGGFSALTVKGSRMTLLSDGGLTLSFALDDDWRPMSVRFGVLPAGPRRGWRKMDRDSESLAEDETGRMWVGFERWNEIWRYSPDFRTAERQAAPALMRHWPKNGGAESMTRLRNGRFLVLSERARWRDGRAALLFEGDPSVQGMRAVRFGYRPPAGYLPTDVAELPDGRLLVLNRRASLPELFTAKIVLLDRTMLREGHVAHGPVVATFASPILHDNFEGMAIVQDGRRTIVWLVSDDNQSLFQRTLLLKFTLDLPRTRKDAAEADASAAR